MNFLLIALGSHGDVHPFVGLATTLQARGHPVKLIANGHFAEMVRAAGIEFIEHGTDEQYREIAKMPELWDSRRGFETVMNATLSRLRELYETVVEQVSDGQTVVAS